ncbi:DDE superfamily endonuclease-domain-containing protein [Lactarius pseudohatsudake]|nr:DDE superfamily endonuclease-domain-containing protein [Lactarius pseudohatsudake]
MACSSKVKKLVTRKEASTQKEAKIQEASKALTDGIFKTISKAARHFDVSYHTLRRRHQGLTQPQSMAHIGEQLLTTVEETTVCTWIKYMGMTGHPFSKEALRVKVADISSVLQEKQRQTGEQHLPAGNWIYSFLNRNPNLELKRPTGLDPKRAQNFNPTVVKHHFQLLGDFLKAHDIPWENVYNMDEKGIQLGGGRKFDNTKFLYSREQRNRVKLQNPNLELVTTIECVGADGSILKPGFIFCGKHVLHDGYFEEEGAFVALSEKGWTSNYIGTQWFEKSFVPQATARNTTGNPILLIYDGHRSHETLELREAADTAGIHLFCIPPHTSHRLQPLDVGVFGPLQRAWQKRCLLVLDETGESITRRTVVREYMAARTKSVNEELIISAWRRSGIRPLNPEVFTEEDFAPSYSSSTKPPFPVSFPDPTNIADTSDPSPGGENECNSSLEDPGAESSALTDASGLNVARGSPSSTLNQMPDPETVVNFPLSAQSTTPSPQPTTPSPQSNETSRVLLEEGGREPPAEPGVQVPFRPRMQPRFKPRPPVNRPRHQTRSVSRSASHSTSRSSTTRLASSERAKVLEEELAYANGRIQELESSSGEWKTHCHFLCEVVSKLQNQLQEKENRKGTHAKKTQAASRVFTSEEGRLQLQELREEAAQKALQQAEEVARKASEDKERRERRADISRIFTGPLNKTRRKEELEDIAVALALPEAGRKDEILERISSHFEEHPDLKTTPRFEGLFNPRPRKRARLADVPVAGPSTVHEPTLPPFNFSPATVSDGAFNFSSLNSASGVVSPHNRPYFFTPQ